MQYKKCKKCRRYGEKLFLKGDRCNTTKCAIARRNYPPGIHGDQKHRKMSEFGTQLFEKQKAKKIYGLREKQFKSYYQKASKQKGVTGEKIAQLLETRLDNIVFRLGFAKSRNLSRQIVNHGHVLVNDKPVDIASHQLKINDVVKIKDKSKVNNYFINIPKAIIKDSVPRWLDVNPKDFSGKVLSMPALADIDHSIGMKQIIESYSK